MDNKGLLGQSISKCDAKLGSLIFNIVNLEL